MKINFRMLLVATVCLIGFMNVASAVSGDIVNSDMTALSLEDQTLRVNVPETFSILIYGDESPTGDFTGENVVYMVNDILTSDGVEVDFLKNQGHPVTPIGADTYFDLNAINVTVTEVGEQFLFLYVGVVDDNGVPTTLKNPDGSDVILTVKFRGAASSYFYGAIPEFPTIALPVAAIIGLAFFMQRRKEE
ncbi:PEF-CTERM sorting domain-containing protein [Methanolobus sp. WCC4]|uniref:PEF-CTERM sorting domain-containing protein n=1 Tax=Methanolobus sp. WCC4 TaxID=3125784 RepID=UPI0030F4CF2A